MRFARLSGWVLGLSVIALAASAQQTLANLHGDAELAVSRASASLHQTAPSTRYSSHPAALQDSATSRAAARAFFLRSDLERAKTLSSHALSLHENDMEALFIRMEVAGIEGDRGGLEAAIRICELSGDQSADPRVLLAVVRVLEGAANTPSFRRIVPRIQQLLANSSSSYPQLAQALLRADMDGVPGLDAHALSRSSGILTDWRVVGPLGRRALAGAEPEEVSRNDSLSQPMVGGMAVENFQFLDGVLHLPDYMGHRGTFYAASQFATLEPGARNIEVETSGAIDLYVDGALGLRAPAGAAPRRYSSVLDLAPGPHHVLLRFADASVPIRVKVTSERPAGNWTAPHWASAEEATYEQAAVLYAAQDWAAVREKLKARSSAPSLYLLAQASDWLSPNSAGGLDAWRELAKIAPAALTPQEALARGAISQGNTTEALQRATALLRKDSQNETALELLTAANATDPGLLENLWWARILSHPSCAILQAGSAFYRSNHRAELVAVTELRLATCSPESLAYPEALAREGKHAEAARALEQTITAFPLNRAAKLMLIRELQLAGDDVGAQRAAKDWLHIAPNAAAYRRMAAAAEPPDSPEAPAETMPFYLPFRRGAGLPLSRSDQNTEGDTVALLDDQVAIARADGSVSLYVHRLAQALSAVGAAELQGKTLPAGAQALTARIISPQDSASRALGYGAPLIAGEVLEIEYVMNFVGDSGISGHPEIFQHVFGSGTETYKSQFVVLTPAAESDRAVVIATGTPPTMQSRVKDGMLARVWDSDLVPGKSGSIFGIVRMVEHENGWSVSRSVERRKRIETSHPGPRFLDAVLVPQVLLTDDGSATDASSQVN